jgi:hypothetical protein
MTVRVPAGEGQVLLRLEATPIRKLSTVVTFVALAVVLALLLWLVVARIRQRGDARKTRGRKG